MILRPIPATDWDCINEANRKLLREVGGVPVNDVFLPLWLKPAPIQLLFGGRGGGKSQGVFDQHIKMCREHEYFNCYYGRKAYEWVRQSCFATICDSIEAMGLRDEFNYSRATSSSMVVMHKKTGNKFVPFGSDRPDKIKSIKDPTHIIAEEFDQFTFDDFKDLYPTLRTLRTKMPQFTGMFNTHGVYNNHWIIRLFFPELYRGLEKPLVLEGSEGIEVLKVFANFTDNHFIDQDNYRKLLWMAAGGNLTLFEAIANGAWGVMANEYPWLYAFNRDTMVKESLPFLPSFPVYISFDFNNSPFEATAYQFSPQMGHLNSFVHVIAEFTGDIKIEEMCQRIKAKFPFSVLFVTGDRSGDNENLSTNETNYGLIQGLLGLSDSQMKINTHNLTHADSRLFINAMLANYPNILIDGTACPNLVRQIEMATVDIKSPTPHKLFKDRGLYKMDAFDSFRYFFQTHFHKWAVETYFRVLGKGKAGL